MNTLRKNLPIIFGASLAVVAAAVRCVMICVFRDAESGDFTGGSILLYSLYLLFAVAVVAFAVFAFLKYRSLELSQEDEQGSSLGTFVYSAMGFFFAFVCVFAVFCAISGKEFIAGASTVPLILLCVFGLGSAVFFFFSAGKKADKMRTKPLLLLLYLLPMGFFGIRMVLGFTSYATSASPLSYQLQNAALALICIYFVYEQRLVRQVPKTLWAYVAIAPAAIAAATLSAFPTLLFSLLGNAPELFVGDPLCCLLDLTFAVYATFKLRSVCRRLKEGAKDET